MRLRNYGTGRTMNIINSLLHALRQHERITEAAMELEKLECSS